MHFGDTYIPPADEFIFKIKVQIQNYKLPVIRLRAYLKAKTESEWVFRNEHYLIIIFMNRYRVLWSRRAEVRSTKSEN